MTPPKEYFEQCSEHVCGAQQVGPVFFKFINRDCLYDMLNEGIFDDPDEEDETALDLAIEQIETLEAELAELKAKLEEKK